jgi:gluconolactonase
MELLVSGHGLIEGPRVDAEDNLYWSDVPRGGVYRRTPRGEVSIAIPKRRGVGGIALHAEGGLVVSGRNICHVREGVTRILLEDPSTPGWNDLFTDRAGRVYAGSLRSDPFREEGPRTPGELWRIDGPNAASVVYGDVSLTNGIGISPDGTRLYHSDSARRHILVSDLGPDGSCADRRVFAVVENGVPDGLAVDSEGGVWVAVYGGGCVARFGRDGRMERTVPVPARAVTSLCFGGTDLRDLYVATADHRDRPELEGCVFRTRLEVPGLPAPLARV